MKVTVGVSSILDIVYGTDYQAAMSCLNLVQKLYKLIASVHTVAAKLQSLPRTGKSTSVPSTHSAKTRKTTVHCASSSSVLVSHGSFLEADGWELLGKLLDIALQFSNLWRNIGLQVSLEVLQLGTMLLLEVLTDLHSPAQSHIPCESA